MPAYGESKSRGQYIDGLGFYWAPNDYWDSKFTLSFGDRQGAVFNIKNQYRLRYKYSGSLYIRNQQFLSDSKDIISLKESRNSNFNVRWSHTQKLRNNQNFNANTTYSSNGDYNRNYGLNVAQSHPQHELAKKQQTGFGGVLSFQLKGAREEAWRFIDGTRMISITANLGDVKTTITHPATTTHGRLSPEDKARAGITENLVRISVGIEAVEDLKTDLERGFQALRNESTDNV